MEDQSYYHLFSNGDDAKNFIISTSDFYSAFNLIAVCAANTKAKVVSFSIEETHPHMLLFGTKADCSEFKIMYEKAVFQHILATRRTKDNVSFKCELYEVIGEEYLLNVAAYTIVQPTKDGKRVLPFDYPWGTASLYFRNELYIPIWQVNKDGTISQPVPIGSLSYRERISLTACRKRIPDEWLTCNGYILPSNYVDVALFESIYGSPNRYRVFLGNSKRREETVIGRMAKVHGIDLDDLEARHICEEVCYSLFEKRTARWLDNDQRLTLALNLRRLHKMSFRQIATLSRLPEKFVREHLK